MSLCKRYDLSLSEIEGPLADLQKASLEAFHALYSRSGFGDDYFSTLVLPMYEKPCVERFSQLFAWSIVDADDIDDDKYLFSKKFSEVSTLFQLEN